MKYKLINSYFDLRQAKQWDKMGRGELSKKQTIMQSEELIQFLAEGGYCLYHKPDGTAIVLNGIIKGEERWCFNKHLNRQVPMQKIKRRHFESLLKNRLIEATEPNCYWPTKKISK